jgi:hypothetical protein
VCISFGIVGVLAIRLALGDGGKATSREGALQSLAQQSFGKVLLILLALGLGAYALWRFVQAFAEREKWGERAGYVGRGLIYAGLTFSAVKILVGAGTSESQNQRAHKAAAAILGWPGGRWIVGLVGAAIVGAGLWNFYRGLSRNFEDKWRVGGMSMAARTWGGRAGVPDGRRADLLRALLLRRCSLPRRLDEWGRNREAARGKSSDHDAAQNREIASWDV